METSVKSPTTEQKESVAINVMRCMLVGYAKEKRVPLERVALDFMRSRTYEELFDFDLGVWKEGPDYLRDLYDEELLRRQNNNPKHA